MNDRSFDQITDAFLAAGPIVVPDRVLDAAFEEVHWTRQRRVLWRTPWRFPTMNTFAKVAVAAVAVIAIGALGLTFLGPDSGGVGGAPSAAPSATVAPTQSPPPSAGRTAPPLTGQFTSDSHGFSIAYPETWSVRRATTPWVSGFVDFSQESGDILYDPTIEAKLFLALASQPLGDRTPAEWEAEVWQMLVNDDPASDCAATAEPTTIDGAAGVMCSNVALVTDGGRGYFILLYTSGDEAWISEVHDRAWFETVLATMKLNPEDAVDPAAASTIPPLTARFTSPTHGYTISYPEGWGTRPATAPWTGGYVDWFSESGDLLHEAACPGCLFLALASRPLGDQTAAEWEAEVWQTLIDDDPAIAACPSQAKPITIDGVAGITACDFALVTDGGRGYQVMLYTGDDVPPDSEVNDEAWFASVLATMELHPEDAVDPGA